ncbi:MAG: helix-turn-helix domain-containing protein [Anaerolineae bacterium]|nr:helix-turn-helix domain-containing protein [Anaerolineae bacterium]
MQPRTVDPAKLELQANVVELRSQGWSFPAIARHLNISVGTAWNISRRKS